MSLTYGFYNSISGDRKYNATQMASIFNGIINDGVFMSIGNKLMVSASGNMNVTVSTGRAWFNSTWTDNDSEIVLGLNPSEVILNRIDSVVLEINSQDNIRANSIKIIKGTPSSSPVAPTLIRTLLVNQYPLCNIYVKAGSTGIIQSNITNKVGTSDCPFITGILSTMNIDSLVAQWNSQFNVWLNNNDTRRLQQETDFNTWKQDQETDFNTWKQDQETDFEAWKQQQQTNFEAWFNVLTTALDENAAGNLLNMINDLDQTTIKKGDITWGDLNGMS